jgi:hypothetical protein
MRTAPSLVATSGTNYYNFQTGGDDNFNSLTIATPTTQSASSGVAGKLISPTRAILVDANGLEYKELTEKGYSDRQIADTLEEYVPLLYNLGDDKTPLTPQQVQLWIDNVKLKLWERSVQHELFNESLDKTYARMLDDIIGLAYIKKG